MNATKKAAGTKRAAFAIEDAIADTRKKVEAITGADLTKQAQAALAGDVLAEVKSMTADLRASSIKSAEGNAARWAKREKAAYAMLRGVKVGDYPWGASFEGSKAALVRAGLIDAKTKPTRRKDVEYTLPLNHKDGYMAACYGPTYGAIPPSWNAKAALGDGAEISIHVEFDAVRDLEVRERAQRAIAELDRPDMNPELLRVYILGIPPVPLSVQVPEQIKAARKYPTQKQAWASLARSTSKALKRK